MTDGILNVDKPAGWTSSDVVGFVRGRSRVKRVGHAGTLDPAATGVLPILLGKATRLAEYLVDATKTYVATIELGVETDTYDAEGEVVARRDAAGVTPAQVDAALAAFRGEFSQTPPAYSAIKRAGVPLYRIARRGEVVEVSPRLVRVDKLDIIEYSAPLLHVLIECSKGFYVRSLAHDVGAKLGVGGSLAALQRTRVGSFRIEDAVDIETLRRSLEEGSWQDRLYAPDEILLGWQAAVLGEANERRLLRGQGVQFVPLIEPAQRCRAYDAEGEFLAVLRRTGEQEWHPEKVFAGA
jgi:tRNA pseudouridine55 synthase